MWLLVGLGNPGSQYEGTRHNAGWIALDRIARAWNASDWRMDKKSDALVAEAMVGAEKVLLVKPQTFMNLSGTSVAALATFYKIDAAHVAVLHDDLDFPIGTIRVQFDRSAAAHNGVSDIIERLGTQAFHRVRIGIGPKQHDAKDFVLGKFTEEEWKTLENSLDNIDDMVNHIINA